MREIKFRCWDKTARKMRQVIEIVFNAGMYYDTNDNTVKLIWVKGHDIIDNKDIALEREHKNEYILMQYTGLKDKNGKEIYEGDIIDFSYDMFVGNFNTFVAKGIVVFEEGAFYVQCLENEGLTKDESYLLYTINIDTIKIIGNIYENPELLEDK